MTGVIATIPRVQFSNALGIPLAGGKLLTYLAGTTTPEPTFQDPALATANPTTITLDAAGGCVLWLDPAKNYKFLLKNALGITQPGWPVDNISGSSTPDSLVPLLTQFAKLSTLADPAGAALVGGSAQVAKSITGLRAAKKDSASKHVLVTGYYAQGDGGGGTYFLDATDTTTLDNGGTVIVAGDGGRWKLQRGAMVSPRHFGAKGDSVNDDTSALNAWTTYMMASNTASNQHACYGAAGTYLVTGSGWHISVGDFMPNLITDGAEQFCIKGNITPLVTIEASGSSGMLPTVEWAGIKLDGIDNAGAKNSSGTVTGPNVGVCVKGACFFTGRGWHFFRLRVAIQLMNEKAGSFTEGVVFEDPYFDTSVITWLQYSKTAGDGSFRSSGLLGFKGNLGAASGPAVLIDSGCVPYMGPMDGIIWAFNANSIFIRNNSTQVPFIGNIDTETQGAATNKLTMVDPASSGYVFLHGALLGWNYASGNLRKGMFIICREYFNANDIGQMFLPDTMSGSIVSTAIGQTFSLPYTPGVNKPFQQNSAILTVCVTAPNGYFWQGVYMVMSGATDNIVNASALPGGGILNNADTIGPMVANQGNDYSIKLSNGATPIGSRCSYTYQYLHGLIPQ